MSAPTEREVVLRERAAFLRGRHAISCSAMMNKGRCPLCEVDAAALFPLPTVTRPRVVVDPDHEPFEWAVINGVLKVRNPVAEWKLDARSWGRADGTDFGAFEPTAARVKMWNDLLAQPTETVDA